MFLALNYDSFLEQTLQSVTGVRFGALTDYIPSGLPWRLIKLHGSVNWGRRFARTPARLDALDLQAVIEMSDMPAGLRKDIEIFESSAALPLVEKQLLYPSIAVPIDKKYEFVCPPDHILQATQFLSNCENFLIIGCALKDEHVLRLFEENVKEPDKLLIANGNTKNSSEAQLKLSEIGQFHSFSRSTWFDGGFDKLVASGELESFLDNLS